MRYLSTRGNAPSQAFCDILLGGLASDGGESSEALFEWYAAEDMENLWTNSSYYPHMQRFTGQPNMDEWLQIKGMVLQSAYTDKGEKNSKVTWTVTKIDKSFNLTLSKKDYHFEGMSEKNEEKK